MNFDGDFLEKWIGLFLPELIIQFDLLSLTVLLFKNYLTFWNLIRCEWSWDAYGCLQNMWFFLGGRCGGDPMVDGFTTTCAISDYHH